MPFSKNRRKDLVIYDLDGTLVDSAVTVTEVINSMRQKRGMRDLEIAFIRPLTGLGGEELIKKAMVCDAGEIERLLSEFRSIYAQSKIRTDTVFDEVVATLKALKTKGCKLSICTNKPRSLAIMTLEALKLRSFFDYEVCGGDVQKMKPNPDPLIELTKKANTNVKNSCFIGDTVVDYLAAKNSGIDFIFYESGYDKNLNGLYKPLRITRHSQVLPYILGEI